MIIIIYEEGRIITKEIDENITTYSKYLSDSPKNKNGLKEVSKKINKADKYTEKKNYQI